MTKGPQMNTYEFNENNHKGTENSPHLLYFACSLQESQFNNPLTKRKSISPIIAVVLMVSITVVLVVIFYMSTSTCFVRSDKQIPTVGAYSEKNENGNFTITIEKVDPDSVSILSVNYILLDEGGRAVPGEQGGVKDIYGLNPKFSHTNITFLDNDRDTKVSSGDTFLICNTGNGGPASSGYSLLLKFDVTGDKMNGGGTRLL